MNGNEEKLPEASAFTRNSLHMPCRPNTNKSQFRPADLPELHVLSIRVNGAEHVGAVKYVASYLNEDLYVYTHGMDPRFVEGLRSEFAKGEKNARCNVTHPRYI